jgi:hypothetical protein
MSEIQGMILKPGDVLIVGPKGIFSLVPKIVDGVMTMTIASTKVIVLKQPFPSDSPTAKLARQLIDVVWDDLFYDTGEIK